MSTPRSNPPISKASRRRAMAALAAVASLGAFGFSSAARAAQTEITDALGRKVMVETPAQRVITLFNYEEFTAIAGASGWDRVVGYNKAQWANIRNSIWRRYVNAVPRIGDVPDVGNYGDGTFSVERVIALRPQVVLIPEGSYAPLSTAIEQLAAVNIPVVVFDYNAQTIERHVASTLAIGQVMGTEGRARELVDLYQREVADVTRRVAAATAAGRPRPRVYLELGSPGPDTVGNTYTTTMWGRIFDFVGGDNIATNRIPSGFAPLNPEVVLTSNPQVIFIAGSSWVDQPRSVTLGYDVDEATARASLTPYTKRPGWAALDAVRNGQVYTIQHGLARTLFDFTAMQYLAKILYPAEFADVDPIASLKRYHERYLPVEFAGAWMLRLTP